MSKKGLGIDLYQVPKDITARVVEFMDKKVWGITLSKRCAVKVEELQSSIKGLKNAEGSVLGDQSANIAKLEKTIEELRAKVAEQKKAETTFAWTDADLALYNSYKDAQSWDEVCRAICAWFDKQGLTVSADLGLIRTLANAISGMRCASAGVIVRSEGRTLTDKRTKVDVLKVFYSTLNELMQIAGTISPAQIPADVREMYAIKKNTKKSK